MCGLVKEFSLFTLLEKCYDCIFNMFFSDDQLSASKKKTNGILFSIALNF